METFIRSLLLWAKIRSRIYSTRDTLAAREVRAPNQFPYALRALTPIQTLAGLAAPRSRHHFRFVPKPMPKRRAQSTLYPSTRQPALARSIHTVGCRARSQRFSIRLFGVFATTASCEIVLGIRRQRSERETSVRWNRALTMGAARLGQAFGSRGKLPDRHRIRTSSHRSRDEARQESPRGARWSDTKCSVLRRVHLAGERPRWGMHRDMRCSFHNERSHAVHRGEVLDR